MNTMCLDTSAVFMPASWRMFCTLMRFTMFLTWRLTASRPAGELRSATNHDKDRDDFRQLSDILMNLSTGAANAPEPGGAGRSVGGGHQGLQAERSPQ